MPLPFADRRIQELNETPWCRFNFFNFAVRYSYLYQGLDQPNTPMCRHVHELQSSVQVEISQAVALVLVPVFVFQLGIHLKSRECLFILFKKTFSRIGIRLCPFENRKAVLTVYFRRSDNRCNMKEILRKLSTDLN
jgi:hypothetical protein